MCLSANLTHKPILHCDNKKLAFSCKNDFFLIEKNYAKCKNRLRNTVSLCRKSFLLLRTIKRVNVNLTLKERTCLQSADVRCCHPPCFTLHCTTIKPQLYMTFNLMNFTSKFRPLYTFYSLYYLP